MVLRPITTRKFVCFQGELICKYGMKSLFTTFCVLCVIYITFQWPANVIIVALPAHFICASASTKHSAEDGEIRRSFVPVLPSRSLA